MSLVDLWSNLILGTLVSVLWPVGLASDIAILLNIVPTGELLDGNLAFHGTFDSDFCRTEDLRDFDGDTRLALDRRQEEHAPNLGFILEIGVYASNEGGVIVWIREVDGSFGWLRYILRASDGDGAGLSRGVSYEAMYGLLSNQETDASLGFVFQRSLEHQGIDELGNPRVSGPEPRNPPEIAEKLT